VARQSKLPRYKEFNNALNAFGQRAQNPKKWSSYLDKTKPISLELGCGKAEVTLGLAKQYPDENFIGVDLKADRLWKASKLAQENKLSNVAFFQANILEIKDYFKKNSVQRIWLTFPDPYPKKKQAKRRMLNRDFLNVYKYLINNKGLIHFKTDNLKLFKWSHGILMEQPDIEIVDKSMNLHSSKLADELKILTTYEKRFIKEKIPIKYLGFKFTKS
jgi:tRNA (guanine-N7-)-methyltransferase